MGDYCLPLFIALNPFKSPLQTQTEFIAFHLFDSVRHPLIFGFPWLTKHNPFIDWHSGKVKGWGEECLHSCFAKAKASELTVGKVTTDVTVPPRQPARTTDDMTPDSPDLSQVPTCYHDLK